MDEQTSPYNISESKHDGGAQSEPDEENRSIARYLSLGNAVEVEVGHPVAKGVWLLDGDVAVTVTTEGFEITGLGCAILESACDALTSGLSLKPCEARLDDRIESVVERKHHRHEVLKLVYFDSQLLETREIASS